MAKWKVATQEGKDGEIHWYNTFNEYRKAVDEGKEKEKAEKGKGLPSTLWAPENVESLNLDRWYVFFFFVIRENLDLQLMKLKSV